MRRLLAAGLVGALLAVPLGAQQPESRQAVFRSTTDVVTVPVFVKSSGGVVGGLRPEQFVVTDNGIRQSVESFSTETMPVDVTILVDTSVALEDYANSVNDQVAKIAALVRPTDRFEILGISSYVSVLLPFGPPGRPFDVSEFTSSGNASVNDALAAALLREADPDRQHVIIALTDTIDTMSTLDMATAARMADHSSATLVLSWVSMAMRAPSPVWWTTSERLGGYIQSRAGRVVPRRQLWRPHVTPPPGRTIEAFEPLIQAAERSGGALRQPSLFVNRTATAIFNKIYNEFRRTYVLRYRPVNVDRNGWHDVTVTVPQYPDLDIRSRRGYYVEPSLPESTTDAPTTEASTPAAHQDATTGSGLTFDDLLTAAGGDDLDATLTIIAGAAERGDLLPFIGQLRDAGNCWPTQPAREFVLALALADAALRSDKAEVRQEGLALIRRYLPLVRPPLGPDPFQRAWVDTAQALVADQLDIRARLTQLSEMGRQR